MENEERAHLEAHYQRELENMKNDITRLTSLLEQALASKSREDTSTQLAVATPFVSIPVAPFVFTSQNLGVNPFHLNNNSLLMFHQHKCQLL